MAKQDNASKAKEIAFDRTYGIGIYDDIKAAALKMADWKDQQFKDSINSVLDYFDRGRKAGYVSENSYQDMRYFASKVFNELFKED